MTPNDAALIRDFLSGESEAVRLVDAWIARAASPYRARLHFEWEDLLQDTRLELTRLLQNDLFRGESSLKTYLWRVVNHACIDRIRATRKRFWETDLEELDSCHPRSETRHEPSVASSHEDRDLLIRVLATTSIECRRLWRMIFEGWSYREMSSRLRVSEGALRVRVVRCRKQALEQRERILPQDSKSG